MLKTVIRELTVITIFLWASPVFLVLRFSPESVRYKWFAWFYPKFYSIFKEAALHRLKEKLFKEMGNMLATQVEVKSRGYLRILELGPGQGTNFKYYPEKSRVSTLDVNESFIRILEKTKLLHPHIIFEENAVGSAEEMRSFGENEFDVVVMTHLLCSVDDVKKTLEESRRVLVPGGKLFLVQHTRYNGPGLYRAFQTLISPFWRVCGAGCDLTRDLTQALKSSKFTSLNIFYSEIQELPVLIRPNIWGTVTK